MCEAPWEEDGSARVPRDGVLPGGMGVWLYMGDPELPPEGALTGVAHAVATGLLDGVVALLVLAAYDPPDVARRRWGLRSLAPGGAEEDLS